MGVDLVRRRDSKKWSCNNSLWRFILDSASSKGWEPHGTQEEKQISGNMTHLITVLKMDRQL